MVEASPADTWRGGLPHMGEGLSDYLPASPHPGGNGGAEHQCRTTMRTPWLAVGYFFSVLPFSTEGLFGELKSKWGLRGRLAYTPVCNNRFMLEFEREGDRLFVLENGPWTHRKDAFLIVPFDGQGISADVVVNVMPIWARIYDVPPLMLSVEVGWELGKKIGKVLRVDADKHANIITEFVRVRVEHNVNKHLLREIYSRELGDDELFKVEVRYERAPRFCIYFGHVRHGERDCRILVDDQQLRYTATTKVSPFEPRKNKGGYVAPDACSARCFLHFGSEVYAESWTAPAKLAWERLGKEQDGADPLQAGQLVKYRKVPNEII